MQLEPPEVNPDDFLRHMTERRRDPSTYALYHMYICFCVCDALDQLGTLPKAITTCSSSVYTSRTISKNNWIFFMASLLCGIILLATENEPIHIRTSTRKQTTICMFLWRCLNICNRYKLNMNYILWHNFRYL